MGTRFFLRAFATIKDVFQMKMDSPSGSFSDIHSLHPNDSNNNNNSDYNPYVDSHLPSRNNKKKRRGSMNEGINLLNLILINPDYELETFRNDYQDLKHVSPINNNNTST